MTAITAGGSVIGMKAGLRAEKDLTGIQRGSRGQESVPSQFCFLKLKLPSCNCDVTIARDSYILLAANLRRSAATVRLKGSVSLGRPLNSIPIDRLQHQPTCNQPKDTEVDEWG
jgi:hypothetical protein